MNLHELERAFPWVTWREPIAVALPDGRGGYACRVCIANDGLSGEDVPALPDEASVREHLEVAHA